MPVRHRDPPSQPGHGRRAGRLVETPEGREAAGDLLPRLMAMTAFAPDQLRLTAGQLEANLPAAFAWAASNSDACSERRKRSGASNRARRSLVAAILITALSGAGNGFRANRANDCAFTKPVKMDAAQLKRRPEHLYAYAPYSDTARDEAMAFEAYAHGQAAEARARELNAQFKGPYSSDQYSL